jgi:hypothetical protein
MKSTHCSRRSFRAPLAATALIAALVAVAGMAWAQDAALPPQAKPGGPNAITFDMVPTNPACQPNANGHVRVSSQGGVEVMNVEVNGLPPNTEFDFFVIQVPHAPFGLSWYQGDIHTDDTGHGEQRFIGRFSIETFIVAPGTPQPAPTPHDERDVNTNPVTKPVHTFHVGLWFNSPNDAAKAGCPNTVTPFNGDHTAGVQVLNTKNFPDLEGPLGKLKP